jgi:prophage antirepressor-like protein
MSDQFIDFTNLLINYKGDTVYIVVDDNNEPWFNAKDIAKLLEYQDTKQAIQINISSENKKQLQDITDVYQLLYKNAQGKSLFLNEKGINELLIKSTKKEAIEIQKWLANDVLPAIKKTGYYEIDKKLKKRSKEILEKYKKIKKRDKERGQRIEQLEHNQKKIKYYDKPCVYIIRLKKHNGKHMNKFGSADDFNKRFPVYNTGVPDKMFVVDIIPVKNHRAVETAVKNMLTEFIYRKGHEYLQCSYNKILEAIKVTVQVMENRDITIESRKTTQGKCHVRKELTRTSSESEIETDIDSDIESDIESDNENKCDDIELDDDKIDIYEIDEEIENQDGGSIGTYDYYKGKAYKYLGKIYELYIQRRNTK